MRYNAKAQSTPEIRQKLVALLLALITCISLGGCNDPSDPPANNDMLSVEIVTVSPRVLRGDTVTLEAVVRNASGVPIVREISWSSLDSTVVVFTGQTAYGVGLGQIGLIASVGESADTVTMEVAEASTRWINFDGACGVWSDLKVYCWQWTSFGGSIISPQQVEIPIAVTRVATGGAHRCAVTQSNEVYCWGDNTLGQLGQGHTMPVTGAVKVVGLNSQIHQVSAGANHSCAVDTTWAVWCWGANGFGQLGAQTDEQCTASLVGCSTIPVRAQVPLPVESITTGGDDRTGSTSQGFGHTCAVSTTGDLYCWGLNAHGQLGIGSKESSFLPSRVLSVVGALSADLGSVHSCAVTSAQTFCWGLNSDGQLGTIVPSSSNNSCRVGADVFTVCSPLPLALGINQQLRALALGGFASCALNRIGEAFCWGDNSAGQAGFGFVPSPGVADVLTPQRVVSVRLFLEITHGGSFACGVIPTGSALCWGNGSGSPQQVPNPN
jgi:alpha-tubulin suppressor-like RCC1 family protein